MRAWTSIRDESGFGLVEVLVASLITATGLVATFSLIDGAQATTTKTRAREGAIALHRELVEAARSVPYERLAPASLVADVQALPGLGDGRRDAAGWTIQRRGVSYTVSLGACAVDDPRDGQGPHEPGAFCASGSTGTSAETCDAAFRAQAEGGGASAAAGLGDCGIDVDFDGAVDGLVDVTGTVCVGSCATSEGGDPIPADLKRVVALVRWERDGTQHHLLQSTSVPNPGIPGAPGVSALTQPAPQTSSGTTRVEFTAETTKPSATVSWSVEGTVAGSAHGSDRSWAFGWDLGTVSAGTAPNPVEVLDGPYVIAAKAYDAGGQSGAARSATVVLNRRVPYPVAGLAAGRNGGVVDVEWAPSKERDVVGYRVYRQPAEGAPVLVCTTTGATACRDAAPPAEPALTYFALALDTSPAGEQREGIGSAPVVVTADNQPPGAPVALAATVTTGGVRLSWAAPPTGDPDEGDAIGHYVIYRDGRAYADRYDRTTSGEELTFMDTTTNGLQHTYWVSAVDTQLAESDPVGPVAP